MPAKKKPDDVPQFFRLSVEVGNLEDAIPSFYAEDPWSNPLCFVKEATVYSG